jgi:hypothetical protein
MLLVAALAPFVVLATRVIAHPNALRDSLISLPITKHINSNGTSSPVLRDRKRWAKLAKDDQQSTLEISLNHTAFSYVVNIGVGDPPTYCKSCEFLPALVSYISILDNLVVDTGSGNTWLGADKPYNKTKTSVKTSDIFVSTILWGFLAQLKLTHVNQNITYSNGSALGKCSLARVLFPIFTSYSRY